MNHTQHWRPTFLVAVVLALSFAVACAGAPPATPTSTPAPTKAPAAPAKATEPAKAAAPAKATEPAKAAAAPTKPAEPAKGSPATVKVAIDPAGRASDAGHFIAVDKGYYKEQNINFEGKSIASGPEWMQLLAMGEIDVGGGSVNVATFNAIARGIPIKMVADKGTALPSPNKSYMGLVARKDLWDSGVLRKVEDLKGRNIALNGAKTGGPTTIQLDLLLSKIGLTLNDVNLVEMGFADMAPALAGKSIDAAFMMEPLMAAGISQGVSVRWMESGDIIPNHQIAIMAYGPKFINERADVAKRFTVAYLKGVRDYNDALVKKEKKAYDEVVAILIKNTSLKKPEQYEQAGFPGLNPDGRVNAESVASDHDWLVKEGLLTQKLDLKQIIDNQFADYAVQTLGKYK